MIDEVAIDVIEALQACRCCLQRDPARNLMRPYIHQGKTEIYLTMLKECFDIHLDLDSKECGICEECVGRLRDASGFKLRVQRSQAELRAKLKRALEIIDNEPVVKSEIDDSETSTNLLDPEFTDKSDLADDNGTNDADDFTLNEDTQEESRVSNDDANKEEFISLASSVPAPAPGLWARSLPARARAQLAMTCSVKVERLCGEQATHACQICNIIFEQESSLATHCKEMHAASGSAGEAALSPQTRGERNSAKTSVTKRAQNDAKLRLNSEKRTLKAAKRFTCDVCHKTFSTKGNFVSHLRVHTGEKPYACLICDKRFAHSVRLRRHQYHHTGVKPYSCEICNKQYVWFHSLKKHQRIHNGERPAAGPKRFICDVCNKKFSEKKILIQHLRVHTGEKPYACQKCDKKFTRAQGLKYHEYLHAGVKPYSCQICHKQYTRSHKLKEHQRIHSGEKPFSCKLCPKKFRLRNILNMHIKRVHTKEKKHACGLCNKRFFNKRAITLHMRKHTGHKPFSCNLCERKFSYATDLQRHKLIHTDDRPYTCDMCNARFRLKVNVKRHIVNKVCRK